MDTFDIIEYLSGITMFTFDKAVLKRIALDRDVADVTEYIFLDTKTKDLLKADLLYAAYLSPNVWASSTHSHGSYTKTIGSQTIYREDKERLYNTFVDIYKKYDDPKLEEIESSGGGTLQWLI
jgi:hypothetical protein